jgi:hypothetical protein
VIGVWDLHFRVCVSVWPVSHSNLRNNYRIFMGYIIMRMKTFSFLTTNNANIRSISTSFLPMDDLATLTFVVLGNFIFTISPTPGVESSVLR